MISTYSPALTSAAYKTFYDSAPPAPHAGDPAAPDASSASASSATSGGTAAASTTPTADSPDATAPGGASGTSGPSGTAAAGGASSATDAGGPDAPDPAAGSGDPAGQLVPPRKEAPKLRPPTQVPASVEMTLLLAQLQQDISKISDDSLKANLDVFRAQRKAQDKVLAKKNEEIEERLQRQREIAQTAATISNVVGWAVVGLSVLGAVFTGGATLVLAGAALAYMAADKITEKVTGESITSRVMTPVMKTIIEPLMNKMADAISGLMVRLGCDSDTAKMVGMIASAVVIAVAVVVAAVALGAAGAKLVGAVADSVPALVEGFSETAMTWIARAGIAVDSSNGVGQGATQVWQGINEREVAHISATIVSLLASIGLTKRFLDVSTDTWKDSNQNAQSLLNKGMDAVQNDMSANQFIARQMRRAA